MKAWDNIINTAMLGTDKPIPSRESLPDDLTELIGMIDGNQSIDKEDRFLQKAAVIGNYRRSGFVPLLQPEASLTKADPETRPYCSVHAASLLKNILEEDNTWLLQYWLEHCAAKQQLLMPEVLPVILDKAAKDTSLQTPVIICSGNRGKWLSRYNPVWDIFGSVPDDVLWLNGKPAERLKVLTNVRRTESAKALSLVQETWDQENAATKADLLNVLRVNAGSADLLWLETLSGDKSVKVKDAALDLLKTIPGSTIIAKYQEVLSQAVTLKKEKGLLGLVSRTAIQLQLPANIDEAIFKTGIEKMVGAKSSLSDEGYIIYQLTSFVPPVFWEQQFNAAPPQVVDHFEKHASALLPALTQAVIRFNANSWVDHLLDQPQFYPGLFSRLGAVEQEKYLMRFFKNDASNIIRHATDAKEEWQPNFTLAALNFMANNPYQYNKGFFKDNIRLINTAVLSKLNSITPNDPNLQNSWDRTRDQLIKLLTFKQQIRQVFTA